MQKHCGNIQENNLKQNGWGLGGIRKKGFLKKIRLKQTLKD